MAVAGDLAAQHHRDDRTAVRADLGLDDLGERARLVKDSVLIYIAAARSRVQRHDLGEPAIARTGLISPPPGAPLPEQGQRPVVAGPGQALHRERVHYRAARPAPYRPVAGGQVDGQHVVRPRLLRAGLPRGRAQHWWGDEPHAQRDPRPVRRDGQGVGRPGPAGQMCRLARRRTRSPGPPWSAGTCRAARRGRSGRVGGDKERAVASRRDEVVARGVAGAGPGPCRSPRRWRWTGPPGGRRRGRSCT